MFTSFISSLGHLSAVLNRAFSTYHRGYAFKCSHSGPQRSDSNLSELPEHINVLLSKSLLFVLALSTASWAQENESSSVEGDTISNDYFEGTDTHIEEAATTEEAEATKEAVEETAEEEVLEETAQPEKAPPSNWKPETVESNLEKSTPEASLGTPTSVKEYVEGQLQGGPAGKEQKVLHPDAKRGLIRITREGKYIYKTNPSKKGGAASVRIGLFDPGSLENENGTLYSDIYTESETPMLIFDYEKHLFSSRLGKLGYTLGSGLSFASGHGRFEDGEEAEEEFTLLLVPLNVGAIYRAQFWDSQILVPYGAAGAGYWGFVEYRDDQEFFEGGAKVGASPVAFWAVGAALNLGALDTNMLRELDAEYGVNAIYFAGEFRSIIGLGGAFDLSSDLINVGIHAEF